MNEVAQDTIYWEIDKYIGYDSSAGGNLTEVALIETPSVDAVVEFCEDVLKDKEGDLSEFLIFQYSGELGFEGCRQIDFHICLETWYHCLQDYKEKGWSFLPEFTN